MRGLKDIEDKARLLVLEKLLLVRDKRVSFARDHHKNTHGDPLDLTSHVHLKPLYNSLAGHLVIQGSVQSMKSEFLVVDHFAAAASGLNVFVILPKYEARATYVQNRVDKCIQMVPEYQRIQKGGFSNVAMRQFGPGTIKYVGSNVVSDFKEYPGDICYVEEVDQCDQLNLEYAQDRLRGSPYQFTRYVGNPTIEEFGINKWYKRSTQNEWQVECGGCKTWNDLDWFKVIAETVCDSDGIPKKYELRDSAWKEGGQLRPICIKCGHPFDRFGNGRFVARDPTSHIEGFHLTMLLSRHNSLSEMWLRFREAQGDQGAMQKFFNSELGLPYSTFDSRLSEAIMRRCTKSISYQFATSETRAFIPSDEVKGPCSMGIDVGKFFDVRISEISDDGKRKAVFIGKVMSREELINLGKVYKVEVAVIDSMPEVKVAHDLQAESPFYVWLCRYGSEGADRRMRRDKGERILSVDRTALLDTTMAEFKQVRNLLPQNFAKILGGEYLKEMTVSVRQSETDSSGNTRFVWSKGKDHQRHADAYDYLASTMIVSAVDVFDGVCVV